MAKGYRVAAKVHDAHNDDFTSAGQVHDPIGKSVHRATPCASRKRRPCVWKRCDPGQRRSNLAGEFGAKPGTLAFAMLYRVGHFRGGGRRGALASRPWAVAGIGALWPRAVRPTSSVRGRARRGNGGGRSAEPGPRAIEVSPTRGHVRRSETDRATETGFGTAASRGFKEFCVGTVLAQLASATQTDAR